MKINRNIEDFYARLAKDITIDIEDPQNLVDALDYVIQYCYSNKDIPTEVPRILEKLLTQLI